MVASGSFCRVGEMLLDKMVATTINTTVDDGGVDGVIQIPEGLLWVFTMPTCWLPLALWSGVSNEYLASASNLNSRGIIPVIVWRAGVGVVRKAPEMLRRTGRCIWLCLVGILYVKYLSHTNTPWATALSVTDR
ncbi:hypothetical protein AVEN_150077-1 [Araneus ventricosus]|uniref:Uncharacterized protein n=1 Tax=Araneus ventricosus TaxID=182803 RepID=A0A4Y2DGA8_ARAVE|nr:hypothetical protein AVEN_150077-1 [Araneus ventricosus]